MSESTQPLHPIAEEYRKASHHWQTRWAELERELLKLKEWAERMMARFKKAEVALNKLGYEEMGCGWAIVVVGESSKETTALHLIDIPEAKETAEDIETVAIFNHTTTEWVTERIQSACLSYAARVAAEKDRTIHNLTDERNAWQMTAEDHAEVIAERDSEIARLRAALSPLDKLYDRSMDHQHQGQVAVEVSIGAVIRAHSALNKTP